MTQLCLRKYLNNHRTSALKSTNSPWVSKGALCQARLLTACHYLESILCESTLQRVKQKFIGNEPERVSDILFVLQLK